MILCQRLEKRAGSVTRRSVTGEAAEHRPEARLRGCLNSSRISTPAEQPAQQRSNAAIPCLTRETSEQFIQHSSHDFLLASTDQRLWPGVDLRRLRTRRALPPPLPDRLRSTKRFTGTQLGVSRADRLTGMATFTVTEPESIHSAAFQAVAVREMAASPQAIFDALIDHERWPEWFTSVERVERYGDKESGVGSNRRVYINKRLVIEEEFNVWEPNERFGFAVLNSTVGGIQSMNELVTIEEIDDTTSRVTYRMGINPKWFAAPLFKLAGRQMRKNLIDALENLESYLRT